MIVLLCFFVLLTGCGGNAPEVPTSATAQQAAIATAAPTASPTFAPTNVPPTNTPVPPTNTPAPTITPRPPTHTPAPPTVTPAPPTVTPVPPTDIPAPPAQETAPATDVQPTDAPAPPAQAAPAPVERRYMFPVQSSGKISYGQYHHDYPATDIFCPIGSQFVAPTGGVVDWISTEDTWDPATDDPAVRGGRSVAIIGDDGVRYYGSHLSAVADGLNVGQRVEIGQVLGLTGNSGDARFTQPHLHFGISHPTTPDDWKTRRGSVSPFPYLNAWRRGEMVTPKV
jgi:murein DD-endopeptidase MepM/ murein hydrolase activator NlpD